MVEQGFNYSKSTVKEMTDFFKTMVEHLEPKEDKKKSSTGAKKYKEKKSTKKWKRADSGSSVVESNEESSVEHKHVNKYCIRFISHFIELNKKIKSKPFPIPKHSTLVI